MVWLDVGRHDNIRCFVDLTVMFSNLTKQKKDVMVDVQPRSMMYINQTCIKVFN
ncbi:hypothetical protein [Candidatus Hodgkinia cicadicola]|uniref:hypothetical protein n=1 Tax=Candidatus Hodgkinia cicadicola TaxID=573658 RepID=UPI001788CB7C